MKKVIIYSFICAVFLVLLLIAPSPSHAELISLNDSVFGTGSVTLDNSTNLEWLDLSKTASTTRSYVSVQLGTDGAFEGWRYATGDEVLALFSAAGITIGDSMTGASLFSTVASFAALIGSDQTQGSYPEAVAQISSGKKYGVDFVYANGTPTYKAGSLGGTYGTGLTAPSWLVREAQASPVPIPGAVWLLGSGLLGLFGIRRRK